MLQRLVRNTANELGRKIYIHPGNSSMKQVTYGRIRLAPPLSHIAFVNKGSETGLICLSGSTVASADGQDFTLGADDAIYVPKGKEVTLRTDSEVDIVECSAPVDGVYPLQFVASRDVAADPKLSFTTGFEGAHRDIKILLGANIRAGRLVAGVTRSKPGNWTSWPPHEHAGMLEEIYVYVEMPEPAFGLQLVYHEAITPAEVEVVRGGDAVLLPAGYHPNVAIPGSSLNFVWIMAAHREVVDRQWGIVKIDPRYAR